MSESIIIKTVKEVVFSMFGEGKFNEAEVVLRKLCFRLNNNSTTEDKRMVYKHLAWVYDELGNEEMAMKNINHIKKIINKDSKYIKSNLDKVVDINTLYSEIFKNRLTKEDKLMIAKTSYKYYEDKEEFLDRKLMDECNILMLEGDYDGVESVLGLIHNYKCCGILDNEMIIKLNAVEKEIYNDLKEECPSKYNQLIDEIINQNNSLVM